MKRLLTNLMLAAGMAFAFTACQKEEGLMGGNGDLQQITVNVPTVAASRASIADYGDGGEVNRCILQVYREGKPYGERMVTAVSGNKATFSLQLVSSQEYEFVFWADCGGVELADKHYVTTDLANIKVNGNYTGNNDEFDAFFYTFTETVSGAFSKEVTLKRPFGQLNITTTDIAAIETNDLKPAKVKVSFNNIPTSFNALTGELGETVGKVEYTADVIDATTGELTVDYIWAAETEANLSDFTMTFINASGTEFTKNENFKNIPIRRNYQTNVSGNLLTKAGDFNVTISPDFDGGYINNTLVVNTVEAIVAALKEGKTDIILAEAPTAPVNIEIPKVFDPNTEISISIPDSDQPITISEDTDEGTGSIPSKLTLTASTTGKLVINLPNSTVEINGSYDEIEATTADNTLVVSEGTTIGKLTVNKGNVEIYGTVGELVFGDGAGIVTVYSVADAATLKRAAELVSQGKCARIVLAADIDLQGTQDNPWEPMNTENTKFTEFDGAGFTLGNLYVDNYTGNPDAAPNYYGGLFYVLQGTVKNLTIDGATVTCHRGGALVGRMDWGTVENCHVKNVTVKGEQKLAGLIGFVSTSSKDVVVKNSSVEECTVSSVFTDADAGLYQAGGLVGYLQTYDRNVTVEGCSVSGINLVDVYAPADNVADKIYDLEQVYSHAFIGNIINITAKEDSYEKYTVELKNNTVDAQISDIPTCDRTNNYVGWWAGDYNAAGSSYTTKLIIDGVTQDRWIEVKRLEQALRDGGTVNVWRNYDLTKRPDAPAEINIEKPTVLVLQQYKSGNTEIPATLKVGHQQIKNSSELTVCGAGAMTASSYVLYNLSGATLTIEGGTYTATKAEYDNGVAIYNQGGTCTIVDGEFNAPGFTLMNLNAGTMTIEGGNINTEGIKTSYAISNSGEKTKLTINGGRIEGVNVVNSSTATINNGSVVNDHKYYAVYSGRDISYGYGAIIIYGGYFCGAEGYQDVYAMDPSSVFITGGYFTDNKATLADGYEYQAVSETQDGITYNYKVGMAL